VFGFQRLNVYQLSITFLELADRLAGRCRGRGSLAEQLRRAALSVPLNIAEGSGKIGLDARRFYAIARGSALECAAVLDVLATLRLVVPDDLHQGRRHLLNSIVAMLTVLLRSRSANRTLADDPNDDLP
jgi:four helix bundle protein